MTGISFLNLDISLCNEDWPEIKLNVGCRLSGWPEQKINGENVKDRFINRELMMLRTTSTSATQKTYSTGSNMYDPMSGFNYINTVASLCKSSSMDVQEKVTTALFETWNQHSIKNEKPTLLKLVWLYKPRCSPNLLGSRSCVPLHGQR